MGQGAAILGLEKGALKWAKAEGCAAFRGPRVYLDEFRAWWEANGERYGAKEGLPTKDFLERELKSDELKRRRRQDEIEAGLWLPAKETIGAVKAVGAQMRSMLQAAFEVELPARTVGRDVIGITEQNKAAVDKICAAFGRGMEKVTGPMTPEEWCYEI
jgi:hypothetical protein